MSAVAAAVLLCAADVQDNGKPIFYSRNADVPLAFDHLRYYAG
jgi:aldehyde dehydrogenase (NAD+)